MTMSLSANERESTLETLTRLREAFLARLKGNVLFLRDGDRVSISDKGLKCSKVIGRAWADSLPGEFFPGTLHANKIGARFAEEILAFLKEAWNLFSEIRPGEWSWRREAEIFKFEQYSHLNWLRLLIDKYPKIASDLEDEYFVHEEYLVKPDITVYWNPLRASEFRSDDVVADLARSRGRGEHDGFLHAVVSCKTTMRSDRAQNTRTEGLQLLQHRKGRAPHIVAVTAEPVPSRLTSLAFGTGEIDCVYHAALPELQRAIRDRLDLEAARSGEERDGRLLPTLRDQQKPLDAMVNGKRLRDLADLPVDPLQ